jgi:hypothetical protein
LYQTSDGATPVTADGQPVGLMLDKSRGELFSDVELVTNGTFDTDSDWNKLNGATIANGKANIIGDGSSFTSITQTGVFESDKQYSINLDVVINSGLGIKVQSAADEDIGFVTATGNYTFIFNKLGGTNLTIGRRTGGTAFNSTVDNISVREILGTTATQPVATKRPTYNDNPDRLTLDLVDDSLAFTVPTGGWDGYMVVGTDSGTASYGVSLPAGAYELGGDYFFGNSINQVVVREGAVSSSDLKKVEAEFVKNGAKASYGDVVNFDSYWRDKNITEFPLIDTSSGASFRYAWFNNNNLTSFPLIDTSRGANFYAAWYGNNLTSFPLLDVSNGTNFGYAWYGNNLTSFPLLDVSSGTNFYYAWAYNDLTSFPLIDTSSGTTFSSAWRGNNLTSFPLIDTSSGTNFRDAWLGNNLTSFPLLDTSNGTTFQGAWYNNNLTSFPLIDTSSGTNFSSAWRGNNLTSFPLLDVSSGTNFYLAWYGCSSLTSFPANMFDSCLATNFANAFSNTNLSEQSIDNILVSINSNGTSNGTFGQSGGSAPSSVGESAITALRSRGWTITVTGGF